MIHITDEILNKYIDGELSKTEAEEVAKQIQASKEILAQYNALKFVHSQLKNLKEDEVPDNFTSLTMSRINSQLRAKRSDQKFIGVMVTAILGICLGIIGYVSYTIFEIVSKSSANRNFGNYGKLLHEFLSILQNIFSPQNISLTGSVVSLAIIITAYFVYESRKKTNFNTG